MKIQYALMSCNANSRYTAYWPITAAAWLKLGITPVLLFVPDNPSKLPAAPEGSIVHTIPPLSDVHIMPQAVMLRFWASCLYPDAVVITSDMDLVPLSEHFFHTQVAAYPEHAYLHVWPFPGRYPWTHIADIPAKVTHINKVRYLQAWFHIAKGRVMQNILNLSPDWETTCRKTMPYYLQKEAKIRIGLYSYKSYKEGVPWYGEEIYTSIQLHHSGYSPIYYISYQEYQYSGPIWDIIPLVRESIDIRRHRFVGIHLPSPTDLEDAAYADHLRRYGTAPNPPHFLWWSYIRFWYWLINSTPTLGNRIKIIGPWMSFGLLILGWCVLHLCPPPKLYKRALLAMLWHKRTLLLARHSSIRYFFDQLLNTKKHLRSKMKI